MARKAGYKEIVVTSGEGVIRYYEKRGYKLVYDEYNGIEYHYMIKNLETDYKKIYWMGSFLMCILAIVWFWLAF